jgi:hypothetical protein
VYRKLPGLPLLLSASVKEDEKGGQDYISASLLHQSTCHGDVNTRCFHTIFLTSYFFLSPLDGNIEQRVCIKFYLKLGKSASETLEMLHEASAEHSLSQTAVSE